MTGRGASVFFGDNKASEGHGRQSLRSGVVSIAGRGANVLVQVGSTICLARLLAPDDFGLVAMVFAITGFAPVLIDLGTRDAAVQKPSITHEEVSALFWLTVGLGGSLSVILAVCSPLIATLYGEPRLTKIAFVSSLTFVLAGLSCQHVALLRRAMMFQRIAAVEVGANVISAALAIGMALSGFGFWALVFRPIYVAVLTALGMWFFCRWLPGIPKLTPGVKEMLKFGLHVTGFTMTDYLGRAGDRMGLGMLNGARQLGFYQNAVAVYENALGLVTVPLHTVGAASLSKLRGNVAELKRAWGTALSSLSFYAMPAFAMLAVTGQDVVVLLLGEKWRPAGMLLNILALRGPAHVVERTQGWLHVAAGRADRWMRWGVMGSAAQLTALFCGLPFGPSGVAVAYVLVTYVLCLPAMAYAGRPLGIGARDVLKEVGPQMVGAVASAAAGFAVVRSVLSGFSSPVRVIGGCLVCAVVYLLVTVLFLGVRRPLSVGASLLKDLPFLRTARVGRPRSEGEVKKI